MNVDALFSSEEDEIAEAMERMADEKEDSDKKELLKVIEILGKGYAQRLKECEEEEVQPIRERLELMRSIYRRFSNRWA